MRTRLVSFYVSKSLFQVPIIAPDHTKTIMICRLKFEKRKAEDILGVRSKHVDARGHIHAGKNKKLYPSEARAAEMV